MDNKENNTITVMISNDDIFKALRINFVEKKVSIRYSIDPLDTIERLELKDTVEDLSKVIEAMRENVEILHSFVSSKDRFFSQIHFVPRGIFTSGQLTLTLGDKFTGIVTVVLQNHPSLLEEMISIKKAFESLIHE